MVVDSQQDAGLAEAMKLITQARKAQPQHRYKSKNRQPPTLYFITLSAVIVTAAYAAGSLFNCSPGRRAGHKRKNYLLLPLLRQPLGIPANTG